MFGTENLTECAAEQAPVRVRLFTVIFHFGLANHGMRLWQEAGKAPATLQGR